MTRRRTFVPSRASRLRPLGAIAVVVACVAGGTGAATGASSANLAARQKAADADWAEVLRTVVRTRATSADRPAPKPPTGLRVTAVSATTISVSWSSAGASGFGIYLNGTRIATTKARSSTFRALRCGTTYRIGVDAADTAGFRSTVASLLSATAPCVDAAAPTEPTGLRQTGWSQTGAGVEWSAATDDVGVTGYSVYRDGVPVAITQQHAAWIGGLVCGSSHTLAVEALDAAGNHSRRASAVVTTTACADTSPPTRPTLLSVTASTQSTLSVAWQPAADDRGVTEYRTSIDGVQVATTTATTASFAGLACGRSYSIEVSAADAAGNVSPRAGIVAPTAVCPSGGGDTQTPTAPGELTRLAATPTSITLSWRPSTDNVGIAGYGIYRGTAKVGESNTTAFQVTGLACGTPYTLGVDAVDGAGNRSSRSTVATATAPCADTQAPTAPTQLTPAAKTETTITLTWQASSDPNGVAGYRVFRDGVSAGTTSSSPYTLTGLACGKSYTLGVEAYDADGNHSARPSTLATTAPCSDFSPPTAPTALVQTGSTATSITAGWSAATDNVSVAGYALYVAGSQVGTTSGTSYTFSALACGTSYSLGVEAYDAAGNRSARATLGAATAACAPSPAPSAGTVYVAPSGSDANPCTQSQPCLSFGRAYKAAAPGATVLVGAGTYPGQEISLDTSKTSAAPVVFEPAGGAVTVNGTFDFGQEQFDRLGPKGVTVRNMKVTYLRSWRGSDNLTWENIDAVHFDIFDSTNVVVRGGDYGPCQAPRDDLSCVSRIAGTSRNVVVEGASIHDVTSTDLVRYHVDGMFIRGGSNIVVRNSKFWGNMITNIRVQEQPCCVNANIVIENNWFNAPLQGDGVTPRSDAINIDNPVVGGVTVQFNSFAENAGPLVVAPAVVKGNLMQNFGCVAGVSYSYNVFVPFSPYTGLTPCGATDKKVTTFGYASNAAGGSFDYRIAGAGTGVDFVPTATACPPADFEGTPRPQGGACDAGADER